MDIRQARTNATAAVIPASTEAGTVLAPVKGRDERRIRAALDRLLRAVQCNLARQGRKNGLQPNQRTVGCARMVRRGHALDTALMVRTLPVAA